VSGLKSRRKGSRVELEIAHALQAHGIPARKISRMYQRGHDLEAVVGGRTLKLEVKSRARGLATIYTWLGSNDVLIVKADRQPALIVCRLALAGELVGTK
jgi:hypothetical protein